ncbi:phosphosulfolactate synthase-related protein, partial [Trifolium pratense]
ECKQLGFDTIELNVGSLGVSEETLLRFVRFVKTGGMKAKPHFELKFNKSDIPRGDDRAYGAYIRPAPRSSGPWYRTDLDNMLFVSSNTIIVVR